MLSLHLHTHSRLWLLPVTALTNTRQSPSWTLLWWIPSQLDMLAALNMELSAWADDVLIVLREARVLTCAFVGERDTNNKRKQYFTFHTIISDNNWVFFWLYVNYFLSAACSTLKCGVSVNSLLINSPKIWCASRSSTNFTCVMLLCSLLFQQPFWWLIIRIWLFLSSSFHFCLVFLLTKCVFCLCCMTGVWKEEQTVKPAKWEGWKRLLVQCCASPVPRCRFSCRAED